MRVRLPPASWCDLVTELDRWCDAGRVATLWWRDDDAVTVTPALDRLLALAAGVPLTLAVIPAVAEPELAAWHARSLRTGRRVGIIQHGWRHANHGANHGGDGKKSEFPAVRHPGAVAVDLAAGRARLVGLFGDAALPVLAPPWNRLDDSLLPLLPGVGIFGLSRLGRRGTAVPGVVERNVHVDPVAWRAGRSFTGDSAALASLVAHLRRRRLGEADTAEPTGLLTHHLVQDAAVEDFVARLLALTRDHRAARWLDAAEVFAGAAPVRAAA